MRAIIRRAIARIEAGLDEALDLEALAADAALSPLHFHHVFRGIAGETPLEMHRRLRLERAARQLVETTRPVTMIAFDARYETHESFTRAFRKAFAASPSEFRARGVRPTPHITQEQPTMHAEIETRPALAIATLRHVGPYNEIGKAFAQIGPVPGQLVAVYYDNPESTPPDELRSDAGVVTSDPPAHLRAWTLPGGRYAKATHRGSYKTIGETWAQLMGQWIPQHGEAIDPSVSFELYRNTPMDTKEADLLTDIYVKLAG